MISGYNILKAGILLLILPYHAAGQVDDEKKYNNIGFGLFESASIISLNYERITVSSPNTFLTAGIGAGYNVESGWCIGQCDRDKYFTIPHHLTWNYGRKNTYFEFGLGGTVILGNTSQNYVIYSLVGVRFKSKHYPGVYFRISGSIPYPWYSDLKDIVFVPIGIGWGVSF